MKIWAKILIIDDDPDFCASLKTILDRRNYQVDIAPGAWKGVLKALESQPDLILLDIQMPEMDGFEVLKSIVTFVGEKKTSLPHVILLSSFSTREKVSQAIALGIDNFLSKPFATQDLLDRIEKCLNQESRLGKVSKP